MDVGPFNIEAVAPRIFAQVLPHRSRTKPGVLNLSSSSHPYATSFVFWGTAHSGLSGVVSVDRSAHTEVVDFLTNELSVYGMSIFAMDFPGAEWHGWTFNEGGGIYVGIDPAIDVTDDWYFDVGVKAMMALADCLSLIHERYRKDVE